MTEEEHVVQEYEPIRNEENFRQIVREMAEVAQKEPFCHKKATEAAIKHGDMEVVGGMLRVRASKRIPMMNRYNRFLTILPVNELTGNIHALQFTYTHTSVPEERVEELGPWVGQLTVIDNRRMPIPEELADYIAFFLEELKVEEWWPVDVETPPHVLIVFHKL